jgi:hypothetical protein
VRFGRRLFFVSAIGAAAFGAACSSDTGSTEPTTFVLQGLLPGATNDSNPVTTLPANPAPGSFQGTVMGHALVPFGADTLSMFPTIAGVRLTAYLRTEPRGGDAIGIGPAAVSVVTDQNGQFHFPTLAGAEYIVTVEPPEGSPYQGVWVTAVPHDNSAQYPWTVVLPQK